MTDEDMRSDDVEVTMKSRTERARSEAAGSNSSAESSSAAESGSAEQSPITADGDQAGHGHGGHDGGGHDDHLGHTAPVSVLVGVLVALGMLTVLTVAVTAVDLGSQGNFVVAMIIATVKAILVMGYFMHMFWDSRFNVVAFSSSFLFVLLFLAMAVLDGSEYQEEVKTYENDKKVQM